MIEGDKIKKGESQKFFAEQLISDFDKLFKMLFSKMEEMREHFVSIIKNCNIIYNVDNDL